jgi:hypothetical protein
VWRWRNQKSRRVDPESGIMHRAMVVATTMFLTLSLVATRLEIGYEGGAFSHE